MIRNSALLTFLLTLLIRWLNPDIKIEDVPIDIILQYSAAAAGIVGMIVREIKKIKSGQKTWSMALIGIFGLLEKATKK